VVALAGATLQRNPPSYQGNYLFSKGKGGNASPPPRGKKGAPPAQRPLSADLCTRRFAVMWLMILHSAVSGIIVIGSYKTFGAKQPALNSDSFLTLVGSLGAIFGNAAGRFFWGAASDVVGFKKCFIVLTLLEAATMMLYTTLAKTRTTFALATILMLFCMGGNFAMFPAQTLRAFGENGAKVYSFMFTGFGFAALLGPVLGSQLMKAGGYEALYKTLGALALVSTALATTQ